LIKIIEQTTKPSDASEQERFSKIYLPEMIKTYKKNEDLLTNAKQFKATQQLKFEKAIDKIGLMIDLKKSALRN
jgi:uncharacterized circularly permuted ATP-grasp superfamily protein